MYRKLRTGYSGLLRMNPVFSEYGLKDLLPLKLDVPDEGCTRPNKSMYCFESGEYFSRYDKSVMRSFSKLYQYLFKRQPFTEIYFNKLK